MDKKKLAPTRGINRFGAFNKELAKGFLKIEHYKPRKINLSGKMVYLFIS
jgi:hypothetical protein